MKKNFLLYAAALSLAGILSGCEEQKQNEEPKEPVFPEKQQVEIASGETQELTFTAEADWKLAIDKPWCRFVDGEVKTDQLSGAASDVVITVAVDDEGLDFDASFASIDLTMGGKTQTIFEITRPGMVHSATMWNVDYSGTAEISEIEFTYTNASSSMLRIGFSANFDWKVSSVPEWLDMETISGQAGVEAGMDNYTWAQVFIESLPYAAEGEIVLTDLNGEHPFSFPVKYAGMSDKDFFYDGPGWNGITFSADGYVMTGGLDLSPTEERESEIKVYAKDMEYSVFLCDEYGYLSAVEAEWSWLHFSDDGKGVITVSVDDNSSSDREMYVVILPAALVPDKEDADMDTYAVKVTQKGASSEAHGFITMWGGSYKAVSGVCEFADYTEFAGMAPSEFSWGLPDDNTFVCEFSDSDIVGALMIAPVGFPSDWWAIGWDEESETSYELFRVIQYSGDDFPVNTAQSNAIEGTTVYDTTNWSSYPGISYSSLDTVKAPAIAILAFYEDLEHYYMYQSSAAIVLVKK